MWIFTKYGFYSCVCQRLTDGSPDEDNVMVRARNKMHLVDLIARFPTLKKYC